MPRKNSIQPNGAYVRYISRFQDETDYGVTLPGHRDEYRVTRNDAGEYPFASSSSTPPAAIDAVELYREAEERDYQAWCVQHPEFASA